MCGIKGWMGVKDVNGNAISMIFSSVHNLPTHQIFFRGESGHLKASFLLSSHSYSRTTGEQSDEPRVLTTMSGNWGWLIGMGESGR